MRHPVIAIAACVLGLGLGMSRAGATTGGTPALDPASHAAMVSGPVCATPRASSAGPLAPPKLAAPPLAPFLALNVVWCCIDTLCYKEATADTCYQLGGNPYPSLTACALACGDP